MGYGEKKESASNPKLEMPICGSRVGKNRTVWPHEILWWEWSISKHTAQREIRKICRKFEWFVSEGNEKADELAKAGAMLDEGFRAEARAKTVQQEREEVYAALQCAASFHCLVEEWKDCEELRPKKKEKWIFVDQKREEWCAKANKYRCMRCGTSSKHMKMPRTCTGPKY